MSRPIPPTGRVLGIDPGTRRIGVAVSDADRTVATPLEVVDRLRDPTVHRHRIAALAAEWEAVGLVVGLPRTLAGAEGDSAVAARAEGDALGDATGLPVAFYDERLTTVTADRSLASAGLPAKQRRHRVDMVAAAVLLQGWLDRRPPPAETETHP